MKVAAQKVVSVEYRLFDAEAGEVLDATEPGDPMIYLHGAGQVIPGVEDALEGCQVGEEVDVEIAAEHAYGDYDESLCMEIPKEEFEGIELEDGLELELEFDDAELIVTVTEIGEETVTVDANHEFAGVPLRFTGKVIDIRDATAEEIEHGHAHFGDEECDAE